MLDAAIDQNIADAAAVHARGQDMLDNACGQGVPHPLSATNFTTPVLRSPSFAHATAEPDLIILQAQRRSARRCPKPTGYGAIIGDVHAKGVTWPVPDYGGLFGSDRGSALAAVARLRHVHCARAPGWSLADGRAYATVELPRAARGHTAVLHLTFLGT